MHGRHFSPYLTFDVCALHMASSRSFRLTSEGRLGCILCCTMSWRHVLMNALFIRDPLSGLCTSSKFPATERRNLQRTMLVFSGLSFPRVSEATPSWESRSLSEDRQCQWMSMSWRLHHTLMLRTSGLQLNVAALTGTCQGPWARCST